MMAQNLTKFTVVLVLLGIVLAIAVFRPQILPPTTNEPKQNGEESASPQDLLILEEELERRQHELNQHQAELDERKAELNQRQGELDERKAELDRRQAELNEGKAELDQRQAALDERNAELDQRQVELNEGKAELDQRQAALDEHEAGLDQRQVELDERNAGLEEWAASLQVWEEHLRETEARLQRKEANLAELEQRMEGRLRLSVVAAVISGLLAVPSVLFFVALMRQGQRTPDKEVQQAQASRTRQRKRVTQYGRPVSATPASNYSDNGRDKESIEASRIRGR